MGDLQQVLVGGQWRDPVDPAHSLRARSPLTGDAIGPEFPVSGRLEVADAVAAASGAAAAMAAAPPERIAAFLEGYADGIEADADALVYLAHAETALPVAPRLRDVELVRTTGQLRQAARAVRESSWTHPVIDTAGGLRSMFGPLGKPVVVFGPNNFPFAFNAVAGSDFVSAIAARNPVIAKVHPLHPATSQALARIAHAALVACGLPAAGIQVLYGVQAEDSHLLVGQQSIGAVGFTGSRSGGLRLKALADAAGVPFYAEMSSINPVFLLEGALRERGADIAGELFASCTMGSGQFCTKPGVVVVPEGEAGDALVEAVASRFRDAPATPLFSAGGVEGFLAGLARLRAAGAVEVAKGQPGEVTGFGATPVLLTVGAREFFAGASELQSEAFGPAALVVRCRDAGQGLAIAEALEGNLTATVYRATDRSDDAAAAALLPVLRPRVGRVIFDRMPTGVAVSPAMNHGGPYPSSSHPGFSAVGLPGTIRRFAGLHSYDHTPDHLLPPELQDANPAGVWRLADGEWSRESLEGVR
ncbi:aldehyde dehydrogenase (NADP(+)) [Luteimonas sp. A478]